MHTEHLSFVCPLWRLTAEMGKRISSFPKSVFMEDAQSPLEFFTTSEILSRGTDMKDDNKRCSWDTLAPGITFM